MKLEYAAPDSVNMDPAKLDEIETITRKAIDDKITQALNTIVVRRGKIVYHKAIGNLNLSENSPSAPIDAIYPLYSISKPITAAVILMLQERGLLDVNDPIQKYIPEFTGEGKENVKLYQLADAHYGNAW